MERPLPHLALALVLLLGGACDDTPFREVHASLAPAETGPSPIRKADEHLPLRFSVAAVQSPRTTYSAYSRLFGRIADELGRSAEFVQRPTYAAVNDLLVEGEVDVALLCTGGWMDLRRRAPDAAEVVAVPVTNGEDAYRSLVIVPSTSRARRIEDLAGKRFAFTDGLSLSGRSYVVRLLETLGHDPERFFGKVTYTRSHDRSIVAVSRRVVDGAAVHSLVFAHMIADDPELASRVRVIHESPPFGGMPVVASRRLPPETRARLRRLLLDLVSDPVGAPALATLGIDRFEAPRPGLHDGVERWVEVRR